MPTVSGYRNKHYPRSGETLPQSNFVEEAGQTFREGDPVYLNAAGNLAACAAYGALLASTGNKPIGVAVKGASNLAAASTDARTGAPYRNIPVLLFSNDTFSEMPVTHATGSLALTSMLLQSESFQVRVNPAGQEGGMSVAIDQATNPVVQVSRLTQEGRYPVGTQYGPVECSWLAAAIQEP